jgi:hypothetical protein
LRQHIPKHWPVSCGVPIHTYGPIPFGPLYKGKTTQHKDNHPNNIHNLEVMQKYRFTFALETMYHEFWSWDRVSERLWNAFKTKTVPIYYGCYNIEQKVPKDLFIDYRDFSNLHQLAEYIKNFPKQQWIDMTEKAYEWYKTCRIGNIEDLESLLQSLP